MKKLILNTLENRKKSKAKKALTISILTICFIAALTPEQTNEKTYFQAFKNTFKTEQDKLVDDFSSITLAYNKNLDVEDTKTIATITREAKTEENNRRKKEYMDDLHKQRQEHLKLSLRDDGKSDAEIQAHIRALPEHKLKKLGLNIELTAAEKEARKLKELGERLESRKIKYKNKNTLRNKMKP